MSEDSQQYSNLDFDEAERKMLDAGMSEGQIAAMRQYSQGVRNMMQGVIVPSIKPLLDVLFTQHVAPLYKAFEHNNEAFAKNRRDDYVRWQASNEQTQAGIRALGGEVDKTLSAVREVADSVGKLQAQVGDQGERLDRVEASVSGLSEQQGTTEAKVDGVITQQEKFDRRLERVEVTQTAQGEVQAAQGRTLAELQETVGRIFGEITEIRVGMTRRQLHREEHPPDPEIQQLMDAQDADDQ